MNDDSPAKGVLVVDEHITKDSLREWSAEW